MGLTAQKSLGRVLLNFSTFAGFFSAKIKDFQLTNFKLKSLGRRVLVIFSLISAFGGQKVVLIVKISPCIIHQKKGLTLYYNFL